MKETTFLARISSTRKLIYIPQEEYEKLPDSKFVMVTVKELEIA